MDGKRSSKKSGEDKAKDPQLSGFKNQIGVVEKMSLADSKHKELRGGLWFNILQEEFMDFTNRMGFEVARVIIWEENLVL